MTGCNRSDLLERTGPPRKMYEFAQVSATFTPTACSAARVLALIVTGVP
jgi:hypothetical protein